ncbi:hypothetical protein [Chromobacterium vaccinii]|uniref:hypothetical protein n=1 Tax=Chromobacterium vaccinii TaxID=1108595 RepID=UPI001E4023F7|nr:hypothetical protein [Chromobacterium vaccinii]MCD4500492.1 hypothetical protein [Chromobacterium vaccinii]
MNIYQSPGCIAPKDKKELSPLAALLFLSALDIGHRVSFQQKFGSILSHAIGSTDQFGLLNQSLNDLFQRQTATASCVEPAASPIQGVANSTGVAAYAQVASMATAAIGPAISVSA